MDNDREKKRQVSEAVYKQFISEAAAKLTKENIDETRTRLLEVVNEYTISKEEADEEDISEEEREEILTMIQKLRDACREVNMHKFKNGGKFARVQTAAMLCEFAIICATWGDPEGK